MGRKLDPRPFFAIGIVAVLAIGGWVILGGGGGSQNYYDFAACLADNNATMYGFDACPHCNRQKTLIGREAFKQEIDDRGLYVRCRPRSEAQQQLGDRADRIASVEPLQPSDTQGDACAVNVGAGTPTWVIDGQKYVGEQSIRDLSQVTGCPLPEGYGGEQTTGGFTPENTTG
ncbi:MAG: hypothetical protein SVU88_00500 [Candidatus Nanohaloarchaea archaeon]|nr:hypothetical protein [Candidatus Nanohaloarchaea archaeon]